MSVLESKRAQASSGNNHGNEQLPDYDDNVSVALSRIGLGEGSDSVTATTVGSDSSGHTTYSIAFA